jgi:hypothetical protein
MSAAALGEAVVDKLQGTLAGRTGRAVTPADVLLWRVSGSDALDALQAGAAIDAIRISGRAFKLKASETIALSTFAAGDAVWVEVVDSGTSAWSSLASAVRLVNDAPCCSTAARRAHASPVCPPPPATPPCLLAGMPTALEATTATGVSAASMAIAVPGGEFVGWNWWPVPLPPCTVQLL